MLRYLGLGYRQFGLYPLPLDARMNWEFYAVVSGVCAPLYHTELHPEFHADTLWIFPPGHKHGWTGEAGRRCYVTCFHFGAVPAPLEAAAREHGHLQLPLTAKEKTWLVEAAKSAMPDYRTPDEMSNIVFQGLLCDLSLLALRKLPRSRTPIHKDHSKLRVENAVSYFAERIRDKPSIEEVAAHVHVSASNLRRIFQRIRHESPAQVFEKLRLERAMKLLSESELKLDIIAAECGYTCSSDLCRGFKAHVKVTPSHWRKTFIGPYRDPRTGINVSTAAAQKPFVEAKEK
jgi:AraC-like DNA-binding protein